MSDFLMGFVRGYTWKIKMSNLTVFEYWTPFDMKRKDAVRELLVVANGDYDVYGKSDVESVWRING